MKKTILLLTLAFATICLTSCSRGYGCPYTMETQPQIQKESIEKSEGEILQTELIADETEISKTAVIAD